MLIELLLYTQLSSLSLFSLWVIQRHVMMMCVVYLNSLPEVCLLPRPPTFVTATCPTPCGETSS